MSDTIPQDTPQKQCSECKEFFPATLQFFFKNRYSRGGLEPQCKRCRKRHRQARLAMLHPKPEKPVPPTGHKFCTKCGVPKLVNEKNFRSRIKSRDGFRHVCITCERKQSTKRIHRKHQKMTPIFMPIFNEAIVKECTVCHEPYPATPQYFHKNKRKSDGLCSECKQCGNKRKKEWRLQHPDVAKTRSLMCRQANAELYKQRSKLYYASHKEQKYVAKQRRRVAVYGNGGVHTREDIRVQYEHQNGLCYWCKRKLIKYHVDHVIPVSRGGSNDPENIVIACPHCNRSKGNKMPEEWLAYREKFKFLREDA